jgi:hypothetical protein
MTIKKKDKTLRLKTHIFRDLYANAFELYIYDTRANMAKAVTKFVQKQGYSDVSNGDDAAAMVLEQNGKFVDKDGTDFTVFAAMFLNEADLSINIIAHESVHAAMDCERNVIKFIGLYDGNDGTGEASEERLAYTIGEYVDKIITECIEHKIKFQLSEKKISPQSK